MSRDGISRLVLMIASSETSVPIIIRVWSMTSWFVYKYCVARFVVVIICYCFGSRTHHGGPCNTMFCKQYTRFVQTLSLRDFTVISLINLINGVIKLKWVDYLSEIHRIIHSLLGNIAFFCTLGNNWNMIQLTLPLVRLT